MRILNTVFLAVLLLFSCSKEAEIEVVDSSEILPQAKEDYGILELDKTNTIDSNAFQATPYQIELSERMPSLLFNQENELKDIKTMFMPDRLGFNDKNDTYFLKDSIPFHLIEWTFPDSSKTINAFYNWLDCFGANCKSIRIEEAVNVSKEAFIIWVFENKLVYLASNRIISEKDWEDLINNETDSYYYLLKQSPNGKTTWKINE